MFTSWLLVDVLAHGAQAVAADVGGGRTAKQAHQRWTRRGVGMVHRKTGRWDANEDRALVQVSVSNLKQKFTR